MQMNDAEILLVNRALAFGIAEAARLCKCGS